MQDDYFKKTNKEIEIEVDKFDQESDKSNISNDKEENKEKK